MDNFPRRYDVKKMVSAELVIREAIAVVESMDAHPFLTEAVVLLSQAKDRVSDFIDRPKEYNWWLLEHSSKAINIPTYFCGLTQSGLSVGFDCDRALKFSSKEEAEQFAKNNGLVDWDAVDHLWCYPNN